MNIEFSIAKKKIIYLQDIDIVSILLSGNISIILLNIALVVEYELNLISLGQL